MPSSWLSRLSIGKKLALSFSRDLDASGSNKTHTAKTLDIDYKLMAYSRREELMAENRS